MNERGPDESSVGEYRLLAPVYDFLLEPFLHPVRLAVVREAAHATGRRALDVCCGTGRQLVMLRQAGFACAGVDLSSPMLRAARRLCPPDVDLRHEDASAMSLPDSSFDLAVIMLALHEKEPEVRAAILRDTLRVLAPGGLLLVADYIGPSAPGFRVGPAAARVAERLAGRGHYDCWRGFMAAGGLLPFLAGFGLAPVLAGTFLSGALGLAKCRTS